MFWKIFYQLKGIKGLNEAIDNGNIIDVKNFLKVYLDRTFDVKDEEPFKVFDFLEDFINSEGDYKLCESLMIGSKYFETMPLNKVIEALEEFSSVTTWNFDTASFCRYLINKISSFDSLQSVSVRTISNLYECYSGCGIEDLIINLGKDYIIELSKELDYSDSKELLDYCRGTLFSDELKEVCIKGDFSVKDICNFFLKKYEKPELDIIFDIMMNKKERQYPVIDIKRKRKITFFEQFLDELNSDEKITNQHKNYLALKLLESKNYPKMLDWLANIKCEANKKLIDELVGKIPDFTILYNISSKYVSYILEKILQYGNIAKFNLPTADSLFMDDYGSLEKLNLVVDSLFSLNPDVKFSKEIAIKLLKSGVNKFSVLINQYELNGEEKLEVFQALKEINSDWIIVYGVYLLVGDKAFDSTKGEIIMNNIRARKREEM